MIRVIQGHLACGVPGSRTQTRNPAMTPLSIGLIEETAIPKDGREELQLRRQLLLSPAVAEKTSKAGGE